MKKLNYLLLFAIMAIVFFQTCKPKENLTGKNEKQTNNKQLVSNDTIPVNYAKNENKPDTTNQDVVQEKSTKDTILNVYVVPEEDLIDYDPPKEQQMTAPMPQIVTDLFPEYKWKLFVNNEGHNKYYSTTIYNRKYTRSSINDLVSLKYKPGEINDKQLIELFIYLFLHPYFSEMKIISTEHFEDMVKIHYNYKTIITIDNEQIEFYSLVKENRYIAYISFKNNKLFKQNTIDYYYHE